MTDKTDSLRPGGRWYELFSRGARDWLRHNEKIRDAVSEAMPDLIAGGETISHPDNRVVRVPVRFLEHYRFRLRDDDRSTGAGQGQGVKPGDVLRPGNPGGGGGGAGAGSGGGGVELTLEFQIDDILDWLWEQLELPNLEPKPGHALEDEELVREGWNKRGARSRLDRRRTLKEAVKRRAVQADAPPFTDEDLRYRQLTVRRRASTRAVVVFVLDVSSSIDEEARKLAKTFFFWALQGLRRQYRQIDCVFLAHTIEAWEFSEADFFQVRGTGGTVASSGLKLAAEVLRVRYDPSQYNAYLLYASDGENFVEDREPTRQVLSELSHVTSYIGYVELARGHAYNLDSETGRLFRELEARGAHAGSHVLASREDVWEAIRAFFRRQAAKESP